VLIFKKKEFRSWFEVNGVNYAKDIKELVKQEK
jgi:hypothetical protein